MIPEPILANGNYGFIANRGIECLLTGSGTFDGGTVKLQYQNRGGAWVDVKDAEWTETFEARFIPPGPEMRLAVTGISGEASIYVSITPIP